MGSVTTRRAVLRLDGRRPCRRPDTLAVEEPLELRLDGTRFVVTMRTPGHDVELAHGLLHAEGIIRSSSDVRLARHCAGAQAEVNSYNVLDIALAPSARPDLVNARPVVTTSACGICGTDSIEQLQRRSRYQSVPTEPVDVDLVRAAPDQLRRSQKMFATTGGVHAAGLLDRTGTMLCVREDVGRHNAVDKIVGWAIREQLLPLTDHILVVSGRASYELTQKAVLAGIGVFVAVSAPSSLAVDLADAAGLTMIGFVRNTTMNVYTHPDRISGIEPAGNGPTG